VLIYSAGPLLSEGERRFNLDLKAKMEKLGFRVFLAQHDVVEHGKPEGANPARLRGRR